MSQTCRPTVRTIPGKPGMEWALRCAHRCICNETHCKRRLTPTFPADSLICDVAPDGDRCGSYAMATSGEFLRDYGVEIGGNGQRRWGRLASLLETCKINGVKPFVYLKATLTAIANAHPQSCIDDLLPWNFKPSS